MQTAKHNRIIIIGLVQSHFLQEASQDLSTSFSVYLGHLACFSPVTYLGKSTGSPDPISILEYHKPRAIHSQGSPSTSTALFSQFMEENKINGRNVLNFILLGHAIFLSLFAPSTSYLLARI